MFENLTNPEGAVLVIGASGIDMVGRVESGLTAGTSNPAHIRSSLGGVARNVAENLARLGQKAILITAIGDDQIGGQLLNYTEASGVDVGSVLRNSHHPTGSYLGIIDNHGQLAFALDDMRVISGLTPEYIKKNKHIFGQVSTLFVDANVPPKTLRSIFSLARKVNLPVCADPTSKTLAERLFPYLDRMHIITPNANEAEVLAEEPFDPRDHGHALEVARKLVIRGVNFAIITLAEFGVVYATSDNSGHIPAVRTDIVDPTGAGDALTAAVIFALLNGIPPDEAVRLGITAASLTLRCPGAVVDDLSLEKIYNHLVV
jgi:pseudouridine kinase